MSSDDVKALIAEARSASGGRFYGPISDDPKVLDLIDRLADALEAATSALEAATSALEAATSAPAVDREALARFFDPWAWDYGDPSKGAVQVSRTESLAKADAILASGILRDVRDVQAEALEQAADDLTPGDDKVDDWGIQAGLLRARAQAIREARND